MPNYWNCRENNWQMSASSMHFHFREEYEHPVITLQRSSVRATIFVIYDFIRNVNAAQNFASLAESALYPHLIRHCQRDCGIATSSYWNTAAIWAVCECHFRCLASHIYRAACLARSLDPSKLTRFWPSIIKLTIVRYPWTMYRVVRTIEHVRIIQFS